MIGVAVPGGPKRPLVKCNCCWGAKERPETRVPGDRSPCAACVAAGCKEGYAAYWKRGDECPRQRKFRKAGRKALHGKAAAR